MLDRIIRSQGTDVTHTYVSSASYTDYPKSFDESNSTTTTETLTAIVTKPTEEEEKRIGGRGLNFDVKLIVDGSVDVEEDRDGRNDRFTIPVNGVNQEAEIKRIEADEHPYRDFKKLNIFCEYIGDRDGL